MRLPHKLLQIGLFANVIEWYEFSVYGALSAIIAELFFNATGSPVVALLKTFSVFAMSYLIRPLGAAFFGYFGDQYGRRASLKISLLLMSIPTILIGVLPTYQDIGSLSLYLLVILRLIQGFAAGGEFTVSACYVFEAAPLHYRSVLCGIVSNSSVLGILCGSLVASALFSYFDQATMISWAWRIPFLLGLPLTALIIYIRKGLIESPTPDQPLPFNQSRLLVETQNPIKILLGSERRAFLKALCLCAFSSSVGVYTLSVWMPFYLTHFLHHTPSVAHAINSLMLLIGIVFSILAATLSRYIGFQRIIQCSVMLTLILAYPLFKVMQSTQLSHVYIALLLLKLLLSGIGGVIIETLGVLFLRARAIGMSLAFTIPTAILGGLTPLVCTYFTHKIGLLFPAFYIMIFSLLALPAAFHLKTTR